MTAVDSVKDSAVVIPNSGFSVLVICLGFSEHLSRAYHLSLCLPPPQPRSTGFCTTPVLSRCSTKNSTERTARRRLDGTT
eukprot:IDg13605t1